MCFRHFAALSAMKNCTRILIIDDAPSLRAVLRSFLAGEGYQVVGDLANGALAVESIARLKPDIVCLDYNLPGVQGLDLLKQIAVTYPEVAVVMITGDANPQLEAECADSGAAGFIGKPFSPDRISREIGQIAHAQQLYRQQRRNACRPTPTQMRAVIADDSATMRMLLNAILTQRGICVAAEASDGQQAVKAVAEHKPELLCLDMDMPVMNGLDALDRIRACSPQTRTLMITGRMSRDTVLEAGKRGASGYILKPFDPARVSEAVGKLLGLPPA